MARIVAPVALVVVVLVVGAVIAGGVGSGEDSGSGPRSTATGGDGGGKSKSKKQGDGSSPETYEVQPGDVLSSISEETGVPIAKIERLNPEVDPQVLSAGQTLKLK